MPLIVRISVCKGLASCYCAYMSERVLALEQEKGTIHAAKHTCVRERARERTLIDFAHSMSVCRGMAPCYAHTQV
jgi:hypothetical protein